MKKIILIFSIFIFFISCDLLHAQEILKNDLLYKNIKYKTFNRLFRALKAGDVNTIKKYISNDMYERYKVLLEQNEEYPNFLRDFYRDAKFRVNGIVKDEGTIFVDIMIDFPDGNQSITRMNLKEGKSKTGNNIWKVHDIVDSDYR